MRIVIDLQGCQSNGIKASIYDLLFAREMAGQPRGHEIHIVLGGGFPETVEGFRKALDTSFPQERIHLWATPQPVAEQDRANAWRARAGEWVREAFIASLKPDAVYIADLFGGYRDNAISSVGLWEDSTLCAVTLPSSLESDPAPAYGAWLARKQEQLRKAHLWFARSEPAREKAMEAGLPPAEIHLLPSDPGEAAQLVLTVFEKRHRNLPLPAPQTPQPSWKPRLAYIAPLPPEHTGIATYSAELLPALANYYDIEVILDQHETTDPWIKAHLIHRHWKWFDRNAARYDRILYHFGNSPFHSHMFKLLERHPGVVVLHDFFLGDILNYIDVNQSPGTFNEALYASHGYRVLQEKTQSPDLRQIIKIYPANWSIFSNAEGIITHSRFSQKLAQQFYGIDFSGQWAQLPHLRRLPGRLDQKAVREKLGFEEGDFVVCSFGLMTREKCCDELLEAWQASPLGSNPHCHLVFAGENTIGKTIDQKIRSYSSRIRITGFLQNEAFSDFLAAADVAVQLRKDSRGETSGAVLDSLAHGLPTIVNANGSFSELPPDVVLTLPDLFSQDELTAALVRVHEDQELRKKLSQSGSDYIRTTRDPSQIAKSLFEKIECLHHKSLSASTSNLCEKITGSTLRLPASEKDWAALAQAVSCNQAHQRPHIPRLFLDISAIVHEDLKTGIQRVLRSLLLEFLNDPPQRFRVEPVYFNETVYRHARRFTQKFMGLGECGLRDDAVVPDPGDIFFTIDLHFDVVKRSKEHLQRWRNKGVKIYFIVHDLLPLQLPSYFPKWLNREFLEWIATISTVSDGLLCVSKTVAEQTKNWVKTAQIPPRRPLQIGYFHHGANILASQPTFGVDPSFGPILKTVSQKPAFLMVGTVEPRKGHAQALAAFELLWQNGIEANLVVVGKEGWKVEDLAEEMRSHPQAGKSLFWFEKASDEMLLQLYQTASALLYPSEGEGFGLPIIEAAQHELPIVARDLPVFREVAGDHAFYFSGTAPEDLASGLREWLRLFAEGKAPASKGMPFQTWKDAARQIKSMILDDVWYTSAQWDAESTCSPARER